MKTTNQIALMVTIPNGSDWNSVIEAIEIAQKDAIESAIEKIRSECAVCNGTGMLEYHPEERVTHEMALDCGEPEMEGMIYREEDFIECEYCGRPISVVRNLMKGSGDSQQNIDVF